MVAKPAAAKLSVTSSSGSNLVKATGLAHRPARKGRIETRHAPVPKAASALTLTTSIVVGPIAAVLTGVDLTEAVLTVVASATVDSVAATLVVDSGAKSGAKSSAKGT